MPDGWTLVESAGLSPRRREPSADGWSLVEEAPTRARGADGFDYDTLYDPQRKPVSAETFAPTTQPEGSAVGRFLRNAGEMINPITIAKSIGHAAIDPYWTAKAAIGAQVEQGKKGIEEAQQGHVIPALGRAVATVLPGMGPAAAAAGEQIASGDIAGGFGKAAGILAPFALSAVAPRSVGSPGVLRNPNPEVAAAVELGERMGVPVDAATATGNRFVAAAQHVADRSLGGSMVAGRAGQAQAEGLAAAGEQLAARGHAAPVTLEQAGDAIRTAVKGQIDQHVATANTAYDTLRRLEANPANAKVIPMPDGSTQLMPMPVELSPVKQAIQPMYQELNRQRQLTPFISGSGKAQAFDALDRLMKAPDFAPVSTVDAALGELKSFARVDDPVLRNIGQGKVAQVVSELHDAVDAAVQRVGPTAVKALHEGRQATTAKYGAIDVFERLNAEPVKTVRALTAPKDSAIVQLRDIAKQAPGVMPQIGRAYLDDMLATATGEGGFAHAQRLASQWEKLGPQTKAQLFKDPAYVMDLDRFFTLAKRVSETPNPSGTAHTLLTAGQGGLLLTEPVTGTAVQIGGAALSKLLHSRAGVRLLTKGFSMPIKDRAAAAAWMTELSNAGVSTSPSGSRTQSPVPAQ